MLAGMGALVVLSLRSLFSLLFGPAAALPTVPWGLWPTLSCTVAATFLANMGGAEAAEDEYEIHHDNSKAMAAATRVLHLFGTCAALLAAFPATIARILGCYPGWLWGAADVWEVTMGLQHWAAAKPDGFLAMGWNGVRDWAWMVPAGAIALALAYWASPPSPSPTHTQLHPLALTLNQLPSRLAGWLINVWQPEAWQHGAGQQGSSGGSTLSSCGLALVSGAQGGAPWRHAVLSGVMAPFWEEVLFRGFLFAALATHLPAWAAVGISSFWFMLVQPGPLAHQVYVYCSGVIYSVVYLRSGCLAPAIVLHALHNLRFPLIDLALSRTFRGLGLLP